MEQQSSFLKYLKENILYILLLAFSGFIVSCWPHLKNLYLGKSLFWVADNDELGLYLPVINHAFRNGLSSLLDPSSLEAQPMGYYPWLQFIPFTFIAKLFNCNEYHFGFFWRAWGGLSIPTLSYVLLLSLFKRKTLAIIGTILLIFDSGIHYSNYIVSHLFYVIQGLSDQLTGILSGKPKIYPQWRIISPSVSLAFLLNFFFSFSFYLNEKSVKRLAYACISYGLLFYTYFYFWTGVGLGLLICLLADRKQWKPYFIVGATGFFIGLPTIISKMNFKNNFSNDWQLRTDTFLPINNLSEFLIPSKAVFIIILSALVIFKFRRNLILIWSCALSSLILSNHQIITGLQIQNFHFGYLRFICCLILFLTILDLFIGDWIHKNMNKVYINIITIITLLYYGSTAIYLRDIETFRSAEPVKKNNLVDLYRKETPSFESNQQSVITGNEDLVFVAVAFNGLIPLHNYLTIFNPQVSTDELSERYALKKFIEGVKEGIFLVHSQKEINRSAWGPWKRDAKSFDSLQKQRFKHFKNIKEDPNPYLKKYKITHYFQGVADKDPTPLEYWTKINSFSFGNLWKLRPVSEIK